MQAAAAIKMTDGRNHYGGPTVREGGPASYSVLTPTMMSSAGRQKPVEKNAAEALRCRPVVTVGVTGCCMDIHGYDWVMDWSEQKRPTPKGVSCRVRPSCTAGLCPLPRPPGVYALPQLRYVALP